MCKYIDDKSKQEFNDAALRAQGSRNDTIARINSSNKIIFEGIEEIDKVPHIRLRLVHSNIINALSSLQPDQANTFIVLLGMGGEIEINDTFWISTESYLPKKELFEITMIIPREGSLEMADFIRLNTSNQFEFNQTLTVMEIAIPEEAKEILCSETNEPRS
jgi:hypothetical protein